MASVISNTTREFRFTLTDFNYIRNLVQKKVGIQLSDAKQELVYNRLSRRLRTLGLENFLQYCHYIDTDATEITSLINAITTNLTKFFRESHHFQFIREQLIPEFQKKRKRSMRVWSAGCSTGEEAYSIAMTLANTIHDLAVWDIKILATDVDSNVLASARNGVYALDKVRQLPKSSLHRWFVNGKGKKLGFVKVRPTLGSMICFDQLNLLEAWAVEPQDVIFCRNVMIYFNKKLQRELIERFAALLQPGGILLVGHSENLFNASKHFVPMGRTIYQKIC